MKKIDKPLPKTLIKKGPLRTYLLQRLKEKYKPRFKLIGSHTYVAVAERVEREINMQSSGDTCGRPGTKPDRDILVASKVIQLHLYNMSRMFPELKIVSVQPEFVWRVTSKVIEWLDGEIHQHPSRGSTFTIY